MRAPRARKSIGAAVLAVASALPAAGSRGEWPQFRGPAGSAVVADAVPLPAVLDRERGLRWRRELGPGHSSPVVQGERVHVTAAEDSEGGLELVTLALERSSGRVLWRAALPASGRERVHEINGHATPTPVADASGVYAYFGAFGLVAYDAEGGERWRRPLPMPANSFGTASSPILADGLLILNRDADDGAWLEALDPASGETVWRVERAQAEGGKSGWSTPVVRSAADGTRELLVYAPRRLIAHDLRTGGERWFVPGLTDEPCTTPVAAGGLVYVSSYNMRTNPEVEGVPPFAELVERHDRDGDGTLDRAEADGVGSVLSRHDAAGEGDHPLAMFFRFLDADQDGEIDAAEYGKLIAWVDSFDFANGLLAIAPGDDERPPEVVWTHTRGVPECPSPLVHGGLVYMVKNGGILTCLDASSGEPRSTERLDARGPRYASPVAGDGKLYLASAAGVVTVVTAGPEPRVLSETDLGERIMATPALGDGVVYVRTAEALYAFGPPTR